ncbi:MAG: hypothetical protein ACO1RT_03445 [Planctomycetaceae bacterium]
MRSPRVRFAFGLAIALGIDDPIAWMDSKPPEVIDRWIIHCAENPLPDSWQQMAVIASEIYGVTQWIAAQAGQKLDPRPVNHWIPGAKRDAASDQRVMTADQSRSWIESQIGISR